MSARTIVCGVDGSPGGRAAVRVAASLAEQFGARLIVVHVLNRLTTVSLTAEHAAAAILSDEAPSARAEARGEVGDVAGRLAAVADDEAAALIVIGARSRGRSRTFLKTRYAVELAELTNIPVVVAPAQVTEAPLAQFTATDVDWRDGRLGTTSEERNLRRPERKQPIRTLELGQGVECVSGGHDDAPREPLRGRGGVHADARRRGGALEDGRLVLAGRLPRGAVDAARVSRRGTSRNPWS